MSQAIRAASGIGDEARTQTPESHAGGFVGSTSRWFVISSAMLFLALAILNYWPILVGRIPLPTDLIVQFPPWDTCCSTLRTKVPHAEIGDLVTQHYIWRAFLGDSVRQGTLPLGVT